MSKIILVSASIIILALIGVFFFSSQNKDQTSQPISTQEKETTTQSLSIGDKTTISVEIADTPEKTTLGLSYRDSLPENQGMLFIFPESHIPTFWMKGMKFPLDMIWIDENNTIVDITQNVPYPSPGTMEFELPHYSPNLPAKMVLEVNSGFVERNNVEVGDSIGFLE